LLKIRLSRTGKKKQPSFRVVVQEHTSPIKGRFVEALGFYRPAEDPKVFNVDVDRVKHWISVGAQPSDTVAVLLKKQGLEGMDKFIEARNKKAKKKKAAPEETKQAAPAPAPAEAPVAPVAEEAPVEEPKAETPAEPPQESPKEESPVAPEAPVEPAPEAPAEEPKSE
jgi:small subunit ribosomal protein S16